jgi:hypothetical protein
MIIKGDIPEYVEMEKPEEEKPEGEFQDQADDESMVGRVMLRPPLHLYALWVATTVR